MTCLLPRTELLYCRTELWSCTELWSIPVQSCGKNRLVSSRKRRGPEGNGAFVPTGSADQPRNVGAPPQQGVKLVACVRRRPSFQRPTFIGCAHVYHFLKSKSNTYRIACQKHATKPLNL